MFTQEDKSVPGSQPEKLSDRPWNRSLKLFGYLGIAKPLHGGISNCRKVRRQARAICGVSLLVVGLSDGLRLRLRAARMASRSRRNNDDPSNDPGTGEQMVLNVVAPTMRVDKLRIDEEQVTPIKSIICL